MNQASVYLLPWVVVCLHWLSTPLEKAPVRISSGLNSVAMLAVGYIMSCTTSLLWRVKCGETCRISLLLGHTEPWGADVGSVFPIHTLTSDLASKHVRWPPSGAVGQVPPTPYTYSAVCVHTEHIFFLLTQILIFFPQRAVSQSKRGSLFYWRACLFSNGRGRKWGNIVDTAQWCIQAHLGSTGSHTWSTQLTRHKTESAILHFMGWFIITLLTPSEIVLLQIWPSLLIVNDLKVLWRNIILNSADETMGVLCFATGQIDVTTRKGNWWNHNGCIFVPLHLRCNWARDFF